MRGLDIEGEKPRNMRVLTVYKTMAVLFGVVLVVGGVFGGVFSSTFGTSFSTALNTYSTIWSTATDTSICPIHPIKSPPSFANDNSTVKNILFDKDARIDFVNRFSGAIQVDTTVYDSQPDVDEAPSLWSQFKKFHDYLESTYPDVYKHLEVHKVNTYGLVFYWKGSQPDLKPVMLTAHQDVVPVQEETLGDWKYPPFDGVYDGKFIYGRGTSDTKTTLISILESLNLLIKHDYKPKRGVIAAFGFDEEATGIRGAAHIAKYLEATFGKDSMYAIIDEGPGILNDSTIGMLVGLPAVGEKGYVDITVDLKTPGGHSSMPPDHTSIGIMSELATLIEKDPYSPLLTEQNPILHCLQCLATNAGDKMPDLVKKMILRAGYDKLANSKTIDFLSQNKLTKFLVRTSQAIDLILGGAKRNALPESASMTVNHRIAVESNVEALSDHFVSRIEPVALKYGIGLTAFDKEIVKSDGVSGEFNVYYASTPLEVAPATPTNDTVWEYLAGVTRHIYEDLVFPDLDYSVMLAPFIMSANTDTKYYWNLTKNIFRYTPAFAPLSQGIHSVNERIEFDSHLQLITFFYEYIQTIDTEEADN